MGTRADRVTAFLRYQSAIRLYRDRDGCWDGLTRSVTSDPTATFRSLLGELRPGVTEDDVVRAGRPIPIREAGETWHRYPFMVDVPGRDVRTPSADGPAVWTSPTALRSGRSAPGAWRAYRACGPTLETVRADEEHGSAYVSLRALEALRDHTVDVLARATAPGDRRRIVRTYARELADCRPELVAVGGRIDRVMAADDDATEPARVVDRCEAVIDATVAADRAAAERAAERIADKAVVTISRSGTVVQALKAGDPARIWVLESRPDREGVSTAETLADGQPPVSLVVDAAMSHLLETEDADMVLVGADAVGPEGAVRNKVGTRTLSRAAAAANVPVFVVTSVDKIAPAAFGAGPSGATAPVYDGDRAIDVNYPLFDRTPSEAIAGLITEVGTLDTDDVRREAARRRDRRRWRQGPAE